MRPLNLPKTPILAGLLACLLAAGSLPAASEKQIADEEITRALESELLLDQAVPSHLIDVSTSRGVVTLDGSVSNLLAKERAAEIARTMKGVRSIVNTITVAPVPRTDPQVREDVNDALLEDPATDSYEVGVQVDGGVVTLTGEADSYAEKKLCSEVAKGVKGVKQVVNKVDYSGKTDRLDGEIETEIEKRLYHDAWIDDGLIEVEVDDGEAELTGSVGSAMERARARSNAYVLGVDSVDVSGLEVEWWARDKMRRKLRYGTKTDAQIEKAVEDAFLYDPRVYSFELNTDVEYATVTLTGTVDNLKAKRAAEEDARNTLGVVHVKNHIRVRPTDVHTDPEIADRVRKALRRDPYVERHEISVSVVNRKVFLYGQVDSMRERLQADDVASRVNGVAEVHNGLRLDYTPPPKPDWEIYENVRDQLWWSPYVDSEDVDVSVVDGVVRLLGTVEDWREAQAAEENAIEGGAERVINKLQVRNGPKISRP